MTNETNGLGLPDSQAFERPEGLHKALTALAWLVGRWEGTGHGTNAAGVDFQFEQCIDFSHDGGDYLFYVSQSFLLDDAGKAIEPFSIESGFWRPKADASIEMSLAHSKGWSEVLVGEIALTRIDLRSDAVMRCESSAVKYSASQRLYGKVEDDLMYAIDAAFEDRPLAPYMWGRLKRV